MLIFSLALRYRHKLYEYVNKIQSSEPSFIINNFLALLTDSHVLGFLFYAPSDLALRNCYLTGDLTVKVGDYGIGPYRYKVRMFAVFLLITDLITINKVSSDGKKNLHNRLCRCLTWC